MNCTRREFVSGGLSTIAAASARRVQRTFESIRSKDVSTVLNLSATEVLGLFAKGDFSCEQYSTAVLEQCRRQKELNAFIWLNEEHLLEAARRADKARRNKQTAPLLGLPVALKDCIDTANAPTTAGTPALRYHRPRADAPVAASLFSAGALLLGKTNMHELAFGITSNNTAFGAVHNPYDRTMIAGGSSGGTAAAIAGRLCPAGLGADTGGSIRIPAALCGVAGLRTSWGRYPVRGVVPLSHTRDTVGPMARSVTDLLLLDSTITGDTTPAQSWTLKGLRLGVPRAYFYDNLDRAVALVVEAALLKLRDVGCVLVEADIPDIEKLSAISGRLSQYECITDLSHYLAEEGLNLTTQDVIRQIASPDVRKLYEDALGPQMPTREWYEHAIAVDRPALQAAYGAYFRGHDVKAIVFPTTALPARPIGQDAEVDLNGKKVSTFFTYLRNTRPVTSAGIPGLSLPIGLTSAGLPVGLEFDGPKDHDRDLLGIGIAIERVFGRLAPPNAA
jgi:Asp-tRNA(Asn)/Glu-tRNA(Gln) amidotransferase A subunit family amidase